MILGSKYDSGKIEEELIKIPTSINVVATPFCYLYRALLYHLSFFL